MAELSLPEALEAATVALHDAATAANDDAADLDLTQCADTAKQFRDITERLTTLVGVLADRLPALVHIYDGRVSDARGYNPSCRLVAAHNAATTARLALSVAGDRLGDVATHLDDITVTEAQ